MFTLITSTMSLIVLYEIICLFSGNTIHMGYFVPKPYSVELARVLQQLRSKLKVNI